MTNARIDDLGISRASSSFFWIISFANTEVQKEVCEKGGLTILLKVLKEHSGNVSVSETCCAAMRTVLSSPEMHSKYCTSEVIRAVEECYVKHNDSEKIKHSLQSIKREEDPRVCGAVSRGVCTKEVFPKCIEDCGSDEGCYYCPKCCVQQKAFRCLTCDKGGDWLYCEVCWKRDHQGHKGEEFFCPAICASYK